MNILIIVAVLFVGTLFVCGYMLNNEIMCYIAWGISMLGFLLAWFAILDILGMILIIFTVISITISIITYTVIKIYKRHATEKKEKQEQQEQYWHKTRQMIIDLKDEYYNDAMIRRYAEPKCVKDDEFCEGYKEPEVKK